MSPVGVFVAYLGTYLLGCFVGVVVGMVIEAERHRDWYGNVRGDGE